MAQYYEFTDPVTAMKVRIGARDVNDDGIPEYVEDKELAIGGFSGTEGVDWENMTFSE